MMVRADTLFGNPVGKSIDLNDAILNHFIEFEVKHAMMVGRDILQM